MAQLEAILDRYPELLFQREKHVSVLYCTVLSLLVTRWSEG